MMVHAFPLLFLVTALISIALYDWTDHDIYVVLAVSSALICLIWGLVIAHWSLQLLSLLAVLWLTSPMLGVAQANK